MSKIRERLSINPFLLGKEFKFFTRHYSRQVEEDGTTVNISSSEEEISGGKYTKVFTNALNRKFVMKLPIHAQQLLFWISFRLEEEGDMAYINRETYKEETGVSDTTLYRAITTLKKSNIIAKVDGTHGSKCQWYWVNIDFMFSGGLGRRYPHLLKQKK